MCKSETIEKIHPFEAAGLGIAPFKLLGLEHQEMSYGERVIGSAGGCAITTKPGGTCAYCGQYIVRMYQIESADGKRFHVGCDCVLKTGDAKLKAGVKTIVNRINRERARKLKAESAAADRSFAESFDLSRVESFPHLISYRAERGETLADWCRWCLSVGQFSAVARELRRRFSSR